MSLLAIFASSLACCLVLTPVVRSLASRYGLVDRPDGRRKLQAKAIPLGGGLAIFLSTVAAVCAAALLLAAARRDSRAGPDADRPGLGGPPDRRRGADRRRPRLAGQAQAPGAIRRRGIVMSCGVVVRTVYFFGVDVDLGLLSFPFTAFLLLGAINSLNLLDGMDGLLSCIGLMICLAMAVIAVLLAHWPAACVAAALAGALLGFLRYNSPPASIFMGDCGSMVVGLVIGVVAIQGSLKGPATVALAAPLAVLTLPIFDTLAAIVRRKLTGRSIYCRRPRPPAPLPAAQRAFRAARALLRLGVVAGDASRRAGQRGLARRVGRRHQRR